MAATPSRDLIPRSPSCRTALHRVLVVMEELPLTGWDPPVRSRKVQLYTLLTSSARELSAVLQSCCALYIHKPAADFSPGGYQKTCSAAVRRASAVLGCTMPRP